MAVPRKPVLIACAVGVLLLAACSNSAAPEPSAESESTTAAPSAQSSEDTSQRVVFEPAFGGVPDPDPAEGADEYLGVAVADFPAPPPEIAGVLGQDRADRFGADVLYTLAILNSTTIARTEPVQLKHVDALHQRFDPFVSWAARESLTDAVPASTQGDASLMAWYLHRYGSGGINVEPTSYEADPETPWRVYIEDVSVGAEVTYLDPQAEGNGLHACVPVTFKRHTAIPVLGESAPVHVVDDSEHSYCWDDSGRWVLDSTNFLISHATRPDGTVG